MSAATITPEAASAELLIELYELVQRYDDEGGYLDDLDECGTLADTLTTVLRRFRGRINRAKKTRAAEPPPPAPEPQPQEPPARPPQEAPETPPEPPGPRWPERLNTVALAVVCAVIAPLVGVRALGRGVARLVRRVRAALSLRGEP